MSDGSTTAYDFSAFSGNTANGGQGGLTAGGQGAGMSFLGGSAGAISGMPAGGSAAAGGSPFGSTSGMSSSPAAGAAASAAPAGPGGNLASLLSQSPFGALLNLPGVTAENLFSNVNPANYSGGNPFAALGSSAMTGAYGGNPFAAIGPSVNQAVAGGMPATGIVLIQQ